MELKIDAATFLDVVVLMKLEEELQLLHQALVDAFQALEPVEAIALEAFLAEVESVVVELQVEIAQEQLHRQAVEETELLVLKQAEWALPDEAQQLLATLTLVLDPFCQL